jgi:hypothetical protein
MGMRQWAAERDEICHQPRRRGRLLRRRVGIIDGLGRDLADDLATGRAKVAFILDRAGRMVQIVPVDLREFRL